MRKYIALQDIADKGWENTPGEIKAGDILECSNWDRVPTLMFNGIPVCDEDSRMAKENFKMIEE